MFRRRREPSVQTLPEYFDSIEEDDSEGGFWNFDNTSKRVERKYCRSESEIYENVCKVERKPGDGFPQNRHSTSTLINMDTPKEITNGSKFFQSSNDIRSSQRSNCKNTYRRPCGEKLAPRNGPGSTQSCTSPQASSVGLPYSRFYMRTWELEGLSRCTFNFYAMPSFLLSRYCHVFIQIHSDFRTVKFQYSSFCSLRKMPSFLYIFHFFDLVWILRLFRVDVLSAWFNFILSWIFHTCCLIENEENSRLGIDSHWLDNKVSEVDSARDKVFNHLHLSCSNSCQLFKVTTWSTCFARTSAYASTVGHTHKALYSYLEYVRLEKNPWQLWLADRSVIIKILSLMTGKREGLANSTFFSFLSLIWCVFLF